MCKALWCSLLVMFGLAAAAAEPGHASQSVVMHRLGDDLFAAGGSVTVNQPVAGDLIVSGGSVDVDGAVAGDAVAFGGKLRLGADVGQSVYAAAGQITINGKVGRSVRVAGGQVELGPKSEIVGNVSAAGGQLRLLGTVKGHVQAAGGRVLIDGPVSGDVIATTGQVELGPNARIAGALRYRSSEALRQDPAAQVGGIERLQAPPRRGDDDGKADRGDAGHGVAAVFGGVWTLGLIVLAGVLLAALPDFSSAIARTLRERIGVSLLLGFVFLVCVPVAAVILFITLIGIPLGLFALALYAALLPVAYVSAGIGLGDWVLTRWLPQRAGTLRMRVAATAAALLALALLGWIPGLGGWVGFVALLAGLGALLLQVRRPAVTTSA
jgi:cytoskeletal protein CcmA (bactofilin family)